MGFRATLTFRKFKVALNPMCRIFLNFAKSCISSCLTKFYDNKKFHGKAITVARQLPKKKLPPDPVKVHVQGISENTTEDCLRFYLEKFSDAEVVEVYLGCNNDALATFASEPGNFESV